MGEVRVWRCQTLTYGVSLRVAATKNAAGETLYLAYRGHVGQNLRRYAQRWQAENLHSALKTRGFDLEDTGLTRTERVYTPLMVVSVAFIWAAVTGELLAARTDVQIKSHGHRAVSVFRLGLDNLQDLLLHPSSWRTLTTLMPRFEEYPGLQRFHDPVGHITFTIENHDRSAVWHDDLPARDAPLLILLYGQSAILMISDKKLLNKTSTQELHLAYRSE